MKKHFCRCRLKYKRFYSVSWTRQFKNVIAHHGNNSKGHTPTGRLDELVWQSFPGPITSDGPVSDFNLKFSFPNNWPSYKSNDLVTQVWKLETYINCKFSEQNSAVQPGKVCCGLLAATIGRLYSQLKILTSSRKSGKKGQNWFKNAIAHR